MKQTNDDSTLKSLGTIFIRDTLVKARGLIAEPYAWTKGTTDRRSKRAKGGRSFCAVGAVREVNPDGNKLYSAAVRVLDNAVNGSIVSFNDDRHTTKKQLLAAFDTAIADVS